MRPAAIPELRGPRRVAAPALLLVLAACAGARPPVTSGVAPLPAARGYRALFRAEAEGRGDRQRFRLAVSALPPDRIRLEFLGPVGGPRLVVVATSSSVLALAPADRAYQRAGASPDALERILGAPLGAADLVAILTGSPACDPDEARVEVRTRPAATFGRTVAWYEVSCPPGEIRYTARCEERGGTLLSATLREGLSGAIIAEADYGDFTKGLGPRWPRQVRLRLPRLGASVALTALEGPWASDVPEAIFAPEIPEGFESRTLDLFPAGPALLGAEGPGER